MSMGAERTPITSSEESRQTIKTWTRDVTVNVIANLIAAAVIYLLGVFAGILPRSPYLIALAAFSILATVGAGLMVFDLMRAKPSHFGAIGVILIGVIVMFLALSSDVLASPAGIVFLSIGVVFILAGAYLLYLFRAEKRRRSQPKPLGQREASQNQDS
jgi:predicted membrane channel-forming protein YqfA (hemolysin III family)